MRVVYAAYAHTSSNLQSGAAQRGEEGQSKLPVLALRAWMFGFEMWHVALGLDHAVRGLGDARGRQGWQD